MKTLRILVRATIGVTFPILAFAQSGPQQRQPDPMDAKATVPLLHYESALETYRPMDEKTAPAKVWRPVNDLVRDTGSMSGMRMGDESGARQDIYQGVMKPMDHGAMKNMKDMGLGEMERKKSKPESTKPAKRKTPSEPDSMPGMDMSSGDHTKHGKETP